MLGEQRVARKSESTIQHRFEQTAVYGKDEEIPTNRVMIVITRPTLLHARNITLRGACCESRYGWAGCVRGVRSCVRDKEAAIHSCTAYARHLNTFAVLQGFNKHSDSVLVLLVTGNKLCQSHPQQHQRQLRYTLAECTSSNLHRAESSGAGSTLRQLMQKAPLESPHWPQICGHYRKNEDCYICGAHEQYQQAHTTEALHLVYPIVHSTV